MIFPWEKPPSAARKREGREKRAALSWYQERYIRGRKGGAFIRRGRKAASSAVATRFGDGGRVRGREDTAVTP